MRTLIKILVTGAAMMSLCGCRSTSDLEAVRGFDAHRYMGTWYEAARYPHRFEKGLRSVSARYSLKDDGTVTVLNRGFNSDENQWEQIEGEARFKGSADIGWLKVSFFKPFYASYKIIYLDEAYTRAIVTGPSYGYLWILVRDPALPAAELEGLIQKAEHRGFDRNKIQIINQSENTAS
jgi:apolipoprotein D and lipocalin family protein